LIGFAGVAQELLNKYGFRREAHLASYRQDLERRASDGIPSLDDIEPGKIVGAVIPMSERAQTQMRDSIEVIDYLLNQERVVWS